MIAPRKASVFLFSMSNNAKLLNDLKVIYNDSLHYAINMTIPGTTILLVT